MTKPQFDAQLTSKDGKMMLFIRGPFEVEEVGYEWWIKLIPVVEMGKWARIWKSEEVEDERTT